MAAKGRPASHITCIGEILGAWNPDAELQFRRADAASSSAVVEMEKLERWFGRPSSKAPRKLKHVPEEISYSILRRRVRRVRCDIPSQPNAANAANTVLTSCPSGPARSCLPSPQQPPWNRPTSSPSSPSSSSQERRSSASTWRQTRRTGAGGCSAQGRDTCSACGRMPASSSSWKTCCVNRALSCCCLHTWCSRRPWLFPALEGLAQNLGGVLGNPIHCSS